MNLFQFLKKKKVNQTDTLNFQFQQYAAPELPVIIEKPNVDYVSFGKDNLFLNSLNELVKSCSIQNSIINTKAKMMSGSEFLINGAKNIDDNNNILNALDPATKKELEKFINNNNDSLFDIKEKLSDDYQRHGAMAVEVVWSLDWTKIVTIKHVDVINVRCGKLIDGKISKYYYNRHWNVRNSAPTTLAAFDVDDKEHYNQLIYIKNGNLDYYGEPAYISAMSWINIDVNMGTYHLSNLNNGFAPSLAINVFDDSLTTPQKQEISDRLKEQYKGVKNTGNVMLFFNANKENATTVDAVPVSNLDKQLLLLSDQAVEHIITANGVTSPALLGVVVPSGLGGVADLNVAYNIFNKTIIAPDRKKIDRLFNQILKINNINVVIKIQEFNPLINE